MATAHGFTGTERLVYNPGMQSVPSFQDEKLRHILDGDKANREFAITVCIPRHATAMCDQAIAMARRSPSYREIGADDAWRACATYTRREVEELYRLFELVKELPGLRLLLNHRPLPYTQELWLFLMWFQRGCPTMVNQPT